MVRHIYKLRHKIVSIILLIIFSISSFSMNTAYAINLDLSKKADSNGVYPEYDGYGMGDSKANAVDTRALSWNGPLGRIQKPTAGLGANYNGSSVRDGNSSPLVVDVGGTVYFDDYSSPGTGNSIASYDFQIHSTNSTEYDGDWIGSYTFNNTGSYSVFLNVSDSLDEKYTRGWGNYSCNGNHVTVQDFDGVYSSYIFVKINILVVEDISAIHVEHLLWENGRWNTLDTRDIEAQDGDTESFRAMDEYTTGDYVYLGYQEGVDWGGYGNYNSSKTATVRAERGRTHIILFCYTTVKETGPPSGGGGTSGSGECTITVWHFQYVKTDTGTERAEQIIDDVTFKTAGYGYWVDYTAPEIEGFDFYEYNKLQSAGVQLKAGYRWPVRSEDVSFGIGYEESLYSKSGRIAARYTKLSSSGGEIDEPTEDPEPNEDSTVDIPDDPDTYPTVDVNVNLSTSGTKVNYKTLEGQVSGTVTSSANVIQGDIRGYVDTHTIGIGLNNYTDDKVYTDIIKEDTGSNYDMTLNLTKKVSKDDIGALLLGTPGKSTSYDFYMTGRGYVELTTEMNGNPITGSDYTGGGNMLTLDNPPPTTTLTQFITNVNHYIDDEGNRIEVEPNRYADTGYYYKNTPILFKAKFSDPDVDMSRAVVEIGKGTSVGSNIIYSNKLGVDSNGEDITEINNLLEGIEYNITIVENSLYDFDIEYTPLQEGVYWYRLYCYDAKELLSLSKQSNIVTGTFNVRSEPQPPDAIITQPSFAYPDEYVNLVQASTDPNGVDDIRDYEYDIPTDVKFTQNSSNPAGINGGKLKFPADSSGETFEIGLTVEDATGLTDSTIQPVKIIDEVPICIVEVTDNNGLDTVKENRKITVSAANSMQPIKYPILWSESIWTLTSLDGHDEYINYDKSQTNGNKQRVLQFDKPGQYEIKVDLVNKFSKENPDSPDIGAATSSIIITVNDDLVPIIETQVISSTPNFIDNPIESELVFFANAESNDGDKIIGPKDYSWVVYEDLNDDGKFTGDERVSEDDISYNSTKNRITMTTRFEQGRHNYIKAVATAIETFGEQYIASLLPEDGSWKRTATDDETYIVNWQPKIEIIPDQGPNTIPTDEYNPDPGTPYEEVDIDGDGVKDGQFIRAYTDDTFSVTTKITDEFPENAEVVWELRKKNHDGSYTRLDSSGIPWIESTKVTQTLGHDGGTCRIDEPGIYVLKATVTDDCGLTGTHTVNIRIYTLPQAVLESNPTYIYFGGEWITKENIRFDLRSDPTIVDDEWGVAWHRMDWSKDCWDIVPEEGQSIDEIHVMTPDYTERYNDATPDDTTKFSGRQSQIGGITGNSLNGNQPYRSISFTEPGQYSFYYWGTNYGGKVTVPVKYNITVIEDKAPLIQGTIANPFYRNPEDNNRATISLLGPYASILGREALTMTSVDEDYIDYTIVEVTYDANNNNLFTDSADEKWLLEEGKTTVNGLEYILEQIDPYAY